MFVVHALNIDSLGRLVNYQASTISRFIFGYRSFVVSSGLGLGSVHDQYQYQNRNRGQYLYLYRSLCRDGKDRDPTAAVGTTAPGVGPMPLLRSACPHHLPLFAVLGPPAHAMAQADQATTMGLAHEDRPTAERDQAIADRRAEGRPCPREFADVGRGGAPARPRNFCMFAGDQADVGLRSSGRYRYRLSDGVEERRRGTSRRGHSEGVACT